MSCGSCDYFDKDETWGAKCYCTQLKVYVYEDDDTCSHYRKRGGGGCYMTTACCEYRGLPDDCRELTAMRRLRDEYVRRTPEGRRAIEEYYRVAPGLVRRIDASADRVALYDFIYGVVSRCAALVERDDFAGAERAYYGMVRRLSEALA